MFVKRWKLVYAAISSIRIRPADPYGRANPYGSCIQLCGTIGANLYRHYWK